MRIKFRAKLANVAHYGADRYELYVKLGTFSRWRRGKEFKVSIYPSDAQTLEEQYLKACDEYVRDYKMKHQVLEYDSADDLVLPVEKRSLLRLLDVQPTRHEYL